MALIDVGPGTADRNTVWTTEYTVFDLANPANGTGVLASFDLWFRDAAAGVVVGVLYGSGTTYTSRDSETIGNVASGSKQTFSGLDCSVVTGDFAGLYYLTGKLEMEDAGGAGIYRDSVRENTFGAGAKTYVLVADQILSIYAEGETVAVVGRSFGFIIG